MSLEQDFQTATERVKDLTSRPSNEDLLNLYALYKQATEGDVHGDKPGMFDFKGAAKYSAWDNLKGTDGDTARQRYIDLVQTLLAKHS
jgi:diazepam-binding inhibitor (GABA receptor modulator, acyl-CoA-binding protein)